MADKITKLFDIGLNGDPVGTVYQNGNVFQLRLADRSILLDNLDDVFDEIAKIKKR